MATQLTQFPTLNPLNKSLLKAFLITILCSLSYLFGSYNYSNSPSNPLLHETYCPQFNNASTLKNPSVTVDFEPHHTLPLPLKPSQDTQCFKLCPKNFTNHCPCQDPHREKQVRRQFGEKRLFHRERHCPDKAIKCLVPRPAGYRSPIRWPKSRDSVWFENVPFPKLTEYKKSQNWVRLEGDRLVFPGGGTSFPEGVKGYVDKMRHLVPLKSGRIRTVLDVGCGVASFGACLMDYNILTMSIAPRDIHEAQVQFALERGLPAMLGVLSTYRLPYPSRSFDMSHCSRCLVQWTAYDGLYLAEIDRILRPGGYWVLSGPPINWRLNYKGWERKPEDLEQEQINLESVAKRLCWEKIIERENIAVWRKPTNHVHCIQKSKVWKFTQFCSNTDPDSPWYKKMEACITTLPNVTDIHDTSGGALEIWPKRLNTVPPRIKNRMISGITEKTFNEDNQIWKRRISYYGSVLKDLSTGRYRNIMDMNAGIGGFAAALSRYPVWVMNTVPFDAKNNTLGIVYERGLIGSYMNWCEAFSTYPRTYDLIHAHGVFSIYMNKCDIIDILLEMYRILRPEGAVIIRDHVDIIVKVKDITDQMKWKGKILHSENGPFHPDKILFVDNSG